MSKSVRLGPLDPRTVTNLEIERTQELGPAGLPPGELLGGGEVFQ